MQRMFRARTTEHVMWSFPVWTGPSHWTQGQTRVSCLNGESWECARILHIGENGAVVGPAAASFPDQSVAGMLEHWLNGDFVRAHPGNSDEWLRVSIPHPVNGGVALVEAEVTLADASYFPFAHIGEEEVAAQWPPRPDMPSAVSPEMESARPLSDPRKSLRLRLEWLAPFDGLQPLVISPDDMLACAKMRQIAEASRDDCAKAHAQAKTEAGSRPEGQASVNEAWLHPLIAAEEELGVLIAIAARYGIEVPSLEHAYKNEELRQRLNTPMPVTRVWGVPGLMWALLLINSPWPSRFACASAAASSSPAGGISASVQRKMIPIAITPERQGTSGEAVPGDRVEDSRRADPAGPLMRATEPCGASLDEPPFSWRI